MKHLIRISIAVILVAVISVPKLFAQDQLLNSLTTIDPEIRKYFPRWRICETDIQLQIHRAFVLLGYDKENLDMRSIIVLAAPREFTEDPYEILLLSCGLESMNSVEIDANLSGLAEYLSGNKFYRGINRGERTDYTLRDYCYEDIRPDIPMTETEAAAIISYLEPSNVDHAITVSLFEQSLKLGSTGFWLKAETGTDEVGYHFWSAGESKVFLKRPLYPNLDPETRTKIPSLINAYLGGGYRISSGIHNSSSALSWVEDRRLNAGPGGKFVGGFEFNMPFRPEFGVSMNIELPLDGVNGEKIIDGGDYALRPVSPEDGIDFDINDPRFSNSNYPEGITHVASLLRATGQFTLFYNWWLDESNPENYLRFNFGISYAEVRDVAQYTFNNPDFPKDHGKNYIDAQNISNLRTYKPNELGDWMYFKAEFRNQAAFPFGMSMQYSNQIFLGRIYLPLIGNWLYMEGKYSTPLRGVRPFEVENFFMVSPVIRITL